MGGSSRIVINDQGITISTDGKILYQAGQHRFEKGEKVENNVVANMLNDHSHQVQLKDAHGDTLGKNVPYYVYDHSTQKMFYGRTCAQGKTQRIFAKDETTLDIKIGREAIDALLAKGIHL